MRIVNMGEVSKETLSKKCNKTQKLERGVYFFSFVKHLVY